MNYQYIPKGVCSRAIDLEIDDGGVITGVRFTGGCNGNLQGISAMVKGCKAVDVVERLKGIRCGMKPTSCPDQLANAITQALERQKA